MGTPSRQLVSIIMPAYNAGPYIAEAIRSALAQTHQPVELIVVNDGSTDDTAAVIGSFSDPRMIVVHQANGGIGNARNAGLDRASGTFICFLDADDVMPPDSVQARLRLLLEDPGLSFADGAVLFEDRSLRTVTKQWTPTFTGEPLERLARFDSSCFFGNTWLIRWSPDQTYRFNTSLTHAEDLMFYLQMAAGKRYACTSEPVLRYRVTGSSAMSSLDGLERSYHQVHRWMTTHPEWFTPSQLRLNKYLIRRMMSGAYFKAGRMWAAFMAWLR